MPHLEVSEVFKGGIVFIIYINLKSFLLQLSNWLELIIYQLQWIAKVQKIINVKEVIQGHLPVALPCYDFIMIKNPSFGGALHKG